MSSDKIDFKELKEALDPCPFCNTTNQILDDTDIENVYNYVECECGFIADVGHWNIIAEQKARITQLETGLREIEQHVPPQERKVLQIITKLLEG